MSQFIICIDNGNANIRNAITNYLRDSGWGYWHWVDDVWLTAGVPDSMTSKLLWERLEKLPDIAGQSVLVFRVSNDTECYGRLKPGAWEWFKKNWNRKPTGRI
jgi:hypothetical protein